MHRPNPQQLRHELADLQAQLEILTNAAQGSPDLFLPNLMEEVLAELREAIAGVEGTLAAPSTARVVTT